MLAKKLQIDREGTLSQIKADQQQVRDAYEDHHAALTPYEEANRLAPQLHDDRDYPSIDALQATVPVDVSVPVNVVKDFIDWRMFLLFWGFKGETLQQLLVNPEAEKTLAEGKQYLQHAIDENRIQVQMLCRYEPATRRGNDIVLEDGTLLPMLRSQSQTGHYLCLADYFNERQPSPIGLFTVVARPVVQPADDAERLMSHALCARLAEAAAEWLQHSTVKECSMVNGPWSMLRVAFGYATCPDHSLKRIVFDRLDAEQQLGITLTDHYSIQPSTAVCGLFICHPGARYFPVGRIDKAQFDDYCQRRGITKEEGEQLLSKYIVR